MNIEYCRRCAWQPICGGGCYIKRAYNEAKGQIICYKNDLEKMTALLIGHYLGGSNE